MNKKQPNRLAQIALEIMSSSSSVSDEELSELLKRYPKKLIPKIKNFVDEVLNKYDEEEFKKHLRVSRNTFQTLVQMFQAGQWCPRNTAGIPAKTAETHIAAFLWFAGNKMVLRNVAQIFDTSISTMFAMIERVMSFLMFIGPSVIKFPSTEEEKQSISNEFQKEIKVSRFPGIVGCIDGLYRYIY